MPKKVLLNAGIVMLMLVTFGCGYRTQSYVMVKERVDQEVSGNAGYLGGNAPEGALQPPAKKTRKIYVVELTEKMPHDETTVIEKSAEESTEISEDQPEADFSGDEPAEAVVVESPAIIIPDFGDSANVSAPAEQATAGSVEHVVQKDETLQKIAKKYYDSYGKWTKIYNANKDKIPDPDRIKPGIVLTIPLE